MKSRFNLVEDPWIPVADHGLVSLRQLFTHPEYRSLGGNPVQKIALMKLLLAIAQAAATPDDDRAWKQLGSQRLAERCLAYLKEWQDKFYLYGERPFLQMPAVAAAKVQDCGALLPEVSTGNTTVLSQIQIRRSLGDAEKALLIVSLMSFALAGKKTDNSLTLSPGYKAKSKSGKPGPAVAYRGLLHSFLVGAHLQETVWLNLLTRHQVAQTNMYQLGIGTPPWEQMPAGEDCPVARHFKQTLMGRLVPLCRFCLLADEGVHYSEGLAHAGYKDGITDPSTAVNYSGKQPKALWVDPEKRPWRELTALLGLVGQNGTQGFQCAQIRSGLDRARDVTESFALWFGGLKVSSNAGEQYVSGGDDFVESRVRLRSAMLGEAWFVQLKTEMDDLDTLAKGLYGRIMSFFKELKADGGRIAAQASHLFWQLCERDFQGLVDSCAQDESSNAQRQRVRRQFAGYVQQVYDQFCPKETARQLDSWAKCRPNNSKYLKQEA